SRTRQGQVSGLLFLARLLVLVSRLLVHVFPELWFVIPRADKFCPDVVGVLRQCPCQRRRNERLHEYYGVLNSDLVGEIVFRSPAEAFDDMLLLAVEPGVLLSRPSH